MLLDIHTHHTASHAEQAIRSSTWQDMPLPAGEGYYSVGIHPWHLTEENAALQLEAVEQALTDKRVIAVGEAGLDKLCYTPFPLQMSVFRQVIRLADEADKPLIIHAVRASNEVIMLKKELAPRVPWIIHGFRGKKELAQHYWQHGIYLSFGTNYQEEALRTVPEACLFAETDESTMDIRDWYVRAASVRNISAETLTQTIQQNIRRIFFKR